MSSLFFEKIGLIVKVTTWTTLIAIKATPGLFVFFFFLLPLKSLAFASLQTWDTALFVGNLLLPQKRKGYVVKRGKAGYGGLWPPYVAPGIADSRAPCPYLNAMANHGILPHDGKNIPLKFLGEAMVDSFNFSPSLVKDTVGSVAKLYGRDRISLSDLAAHNVVEHDASLIRHDSYFIPDQTIPAHDLIKDMLNMASGQRSSEHPEGRLQPIDLSRCLAVREARSKRDNPVFSLGITHRFFGASNASLMYDVVQGDVRALRTILHEERFPDGFETSIRQRFGYTMRDFHMRSLEIFLGITPPDLPAGDITTIEAIKRSATENGRYF